MINADYHAIKVAVAYNLLLHDRSQGTYKPNPNLNHYSKNLLDLLIPNLPKDSDQLTLCDIGSGAGQWSTLLSPYFANIVSIEPNPRFRDMHKVLVSKLGLSNVEIQSGCLPNCLANLSCQSIIMIQSMYLVEDWLGVFREVVAMESLRFVALADGPDTPIGLGDTEWNTPFETINNRRPMVQGDEHFMLNIAAEQGWQARIYDILAGKESTSEHNASRWLIILER